MKVLLVLSCLLMIGCNGCGQVADPTITSVQKETRDASPEIVSEPLAPIDSSLDITSCSSRTWGCKAAGVTGETAESVVQSCVLAIADSCQFASGRICGTLTIHFSRQPVSGCPDHLTYSSAPTAKFATCMKDALSAVRWSAGNFLTVNGQDTLTMALCP